jgi:microcin C transport system substrate-binding protein
MTSLLRSLGAALMLFAASTQISALAADPKPMHGLAMHGDLKYPPDFKNFDYVNPNAPKGGSVTLSAIGTYSSFNPYILKGVAAAGIGNVFETLTEGSQDEAFSEYGLLAESVQMPEDRSWVAFTLRPQARWQDGKPVSVDDVIFSLNILKEKGTPFFRAYYKDVVKAEKTGERTVKFTFAPTEENRELPLIIGQLPILPKHYWESRQFDQTTLEPPLGSGPYKISAFEPGRSVTYERVKDYWGKDLPIRKGRNNFDTLRYDYYRDATVAIEAFKAGEYDFRAENASKAWATGYDSPALQAGLFKKVEIKNELPTGMQGLAFNLRKDIFKDRHVREALGYAFDFEWTNQNLFYGQYARTKSYFSNSELASSGLPSPDELKILEPLKDEIPPEVFTQEFKPPTTDGSGNNRANLQKAQQILKAAGWSVKDGMLQNDQTRKHMAFEILLSSPDFERIMLPYAKNLERLGVQVSVRTVDTAQYQRREDEFDFDAVIATFGESLSPGNEQRDFWGSQSADEQGGRNVIGIKDPAIDKLVELVIGAPDRPALITRTHALDRVLLWNHFVVPQWHIQAFRVAYWDKFGRPETSPKYALGFDDWWVDPEKDKALKARAGEQKGKK